MSLVRTAYTIDCDVCLCRYDKVGTTPERVRASAKRDGWGRILLYPGGMDAKSDLCPTCLEKWEEGKL